MRMSKKKELVPKLRFPEFSKSYWGITRLNALADKITERNKGDDISRVFTNSATEGVVDQEEYFDRDIANKNNLTNYFVVEKGDYVYNPRISTTAPVGPISKNKLGIGVMSPLYTVFRFRNTENDFYEHFFLTNLWHAYIKNLSNTGARHDRITISVDSFMKMPLPYASPEEEQKIADCLSSIDELIDAESRKLKALEKYKKGLLQKLFPAEGKTLPEWRFPEFSEGDGWIKTSLSQICIMQAGKFINASEISDEQKNNMYPCYGGNGLRGYTLTHNCSGDHPLIGRQGALCGNVTFATGDFYATEHAIVVTANKNIDEKWLYYLLDYLQLNQYATGQAQPGLSVQTLEKVTAIYPGKVEEQKKIANCLSEIDAIIAEQSNKVERLKAHKKGLLQGLFPSLKEADV